MKDDEKQPLIILREEWLARSIEDLKNGKVKRARRTVEAVEIIGRLLPAEKKSINLLPISVALLCTMIVGLSITVRVPTTFIRLVAKTDLVSLRVVKNYSPNNQPVSANELSVSYLGGMTSIFTDDSLQNETIPKLELTDGSRIALYLEKISEGSRVEFKKMDSTYSIWSFGGASSSINLQADTATLKIVHGNKSRNYFIKEPIPELIESKTIHQGQLSTQIELFNSSDFVLTNIQADQVSFVQEQPPRSNQYTSGIISGRLQVFENKTEADLFQGDYVTLTDFKSKRVEIRSVDQYYEVIIEGSVSSVRVGPQGHLEELKPSWLEYIFNQQFVGFFWSAVVFIWGMFWSIRNTLVSK